MGSKIIQLTYCLLGEKIKPKNRLLEQKQIMCKQLQISWHICVASTGTDFGGYLFIFL